MTQQEIKGNLARLLATENLVVEHKIVETASFDVERRVLTLPIWQVSGRVYDMLVGHEVGHALFTPADNWGFLEEDLPKSYVNITEDARIEKLMKRKFPGLTKDFFQGYSQLHDRDFFSVKDVDANKLNLIDRVNLYYKIGAYIMMPFNDDEIVLRDAVGATETFDEAVDAARAIYEYSKDQQKKSIPAPIEGNTDDAGMSQSTTTEKGDGEQQEIEEKNNEGTDKEKREDPADLETPSYEQSGGQDFDLDSVTDEAFADRLQQETSTESWNVTHYMEIDKVDLKHVVITPERVWKMCDEYWGAKRFTDEKDEFFMGGPNWADADASYREWKRGNQREVSYLSKEFEMKKSAAAYARASISKTGVLDTSKLHTYKFNEDIFKKVTVTPDGKNHGLIFILDWSGSMVDSLFDTVKQLLSLCFFCRKSGIPFTVYAFTQDTHFMEGGKDWRDEESGRENTFYVPINFFLMNFVNSDQNNQEFDKSCLYLYRICMMYAHRNQVSWMQSEGAKVPTTHYIPGHLSLSGTPLNETLACLQTVIPEFKSRHGVEKCHVSILTDGEAQYSRVWQKTEWKGETRMHATSWRTNTMLRDRKTGRTYSVDNYRQTTHSMLRYLKGRFPQCNFLGFRIGQTREILSVIRDFVEEGDKMAKITSEWKKMKACEVPFGGYQRHYFISSTAMNDDVEFLPKSDSKADIKRAFTKSLKSKANNKRILSSFIEQIA
tara:strand:- start:14098 stop:16257 length:2160 start_codon:yes stop_codon:yes gene_type:complete